MSAACLLWHVYAGYLLPSAIGLALGAAPRASLQCCPVWQVILNMEGWEGEIDQLLDTQFLRDRWGNQCVKKEICKWNKREKHKSMWWIFEFACIYTCGWLINFCLLCLSLCPLVFSALLTVCSRCDNASLPIGWSTTLVQLKYLNS